VRLIQEEDAYSDPTGTHKLDMLRVRPPLAVACFMAYYDCPNELPETMGETPREVRCLDVSIPVLSSEHVLLLGPLMRHGRREPKNAHHSAKTKNVAAHRRLPFRLTAANYIILCANAH